MRSPGSDWRSRTRTERPRSAARRAQASPANPAPPRRHRNPPIHLAYRRPSPSSLPPVQETFPRERRGGLSSRRRSPCRPAPRPPRWSVRRPSVRCPSVCPTPRNGSGPGRGREPSAGGATGGSTPADDPVQARSVRSVRLRIPGRWLRTGEVGPQAGQPLRAQRERPQVPLRAPLRGAARAPVRQDAPDHAADLKPCPEKPAATYTSSWSGSRSRMKCSSGVSVNMQAIMRRVRPSAWRSPPRALDDPAILTSDVEAARDPQDRLARDVLEFPPGSVRGPHERHVFGAREVGEPSYTVSLFIDYTVALAAGDPRREHGLVSNPEPRPGRVP